MYTTYIYLYGLFVNSQVFSWLCYLYLEKEKAIETFKMFLTSIAIESLKMEFKDVINTGTILLLLVKIDLNNDSAIYLDMLYIECDNCDPRERNNTIWFLGGSGDERDDNFTKRHTDPQVPIGTKCFTNNLYI